MLMGQGNKVMAYMVNPTPYTLNSKLQTPCTLNPQPCTLNPAPSTPCTRKLYPMVNSALQTLNPQPSTLW
jgi:hypothetical protein